MNQNVAISGVTILIAAIYCSFPLLVAWPVIRAFQPGASFEMALGFLAGDGIQTISALLLPLLGAITIIRPKNITTLPALIILAIFVITVAGAIFGYFFSYSTVRSQVFHKSLEQFGTVLRSFVEAATMYILLLLGIKAKE